MILRKIKYGLFMVFIVALVAALYLSLIGLPDVLARNIEKRLQIGDLVITLAKVKLGIFEGVIATQVRCHRKGDIGDPLLNAEKIVLRLSPLAWLKGQNGISGAIIKNGAVSVPLPSAVSNGVISLTDRFDCRIVFARIAWDAGRPARRASDAAANGAGGMEGAARLIVEECSARMPGIQLTGRGELVLPYADGAAVGSTAQADRGKKHEVRLFKLLKAWDRFGLSTNGSGVVNVDVTCFLNPSDMDALDVRMKADARQTRFGKTQIAAWRLNLDMQGASGEGSLDLMDAAVEGAYATNIKGRFRFDEKNFNLQSLDAVVGRDQRGGPLHLSGTFDWKTGQGRGAITAAFDPNALLPLLSSLDVSQTYVIEWFQFDDRPPNSRAGFDFDAGTNWAFRLKGHVQCDNCRFNGVSNILMKSGLVVDMSAANSTVLLTPLLVVREEGMVQGGAVIDVLRDTVRFNGLSTADPNAVARMLDPSIEDVVGQFQFEGPVRVAGWGTAGYADETPNNLDIEVDAQRCGWRGFIMDRCSLSIYMLEDNVYINDFQADFCRGFVAGSGSVYPVLNTTNLRYQLQAGMREVNLQTLIRNYSGQVAERYRGDLSGRLELEGFVDDTDGRTAAGNGWIKIGGGRLFQLPLFGGLSEFLGRIVPGLGLIMRQTDARASFVVKDGKIHSNDIVIEGEVITLACTGDYYLNGGLDFAVQVKLLQKNSLLGGILHLAMLPVTKMLEFRLTGTIREPRWRPAYLPKELFFIFD